jgi:hypothetical protein
MMPNQKRPDDIDTARKAPGADQADQDDKTRETRETRQNDPAPTEGNRFTKERQDRDRSSYESQNQGTGPMNVGDQSRTR